MKIFEIIAESPLAGTKFVTLDEHQLRELQSWLLTLGEDIDSESIWVEDNPTLSKQLERDYRAVTAVEYVVKNNIIAINDSNLHANSIFLYDVDEYDLSFGDFVGAIHVVLHDDHTAEVKWIGSYGADGAGLLRAAMKIAKSRGAVSMKLDAKWESEAFYSKLGFSQSAPTVENPFTGSQLTPFTRDLDEERQ